MPGSPNKPFPADYRDDRQPADRDREREEVARQSSTLRRRATDNAERRTLVDRMQRRRGSFRGSVQIELIPRAQGLDLVAASGRLLVGDFADLPAAAVLELAGRDIVASARTGRTTLLTVPEGGAPDGIAALADELTTLGVPVSVDLVSPLGAWMKGEGGPERTRGSRRFPAVRFEQKSTPPFVAVLDSGVSNLGRTDGYLGDGVDPAENDPLDIFPLKGLLDADAGHGSMVIGVVQQIVPTARVGSYRVADSDGITTTFDVAEKMRLAVGDGATILNLSLGTATADGLAPLALQDVVDELRQNNADVLIVCAAGNDASESPIWPAAFAATHDNVVAVAALDAAGDPAGWSSHGDWVTCSTVGEGIASTYVVGKEDGELIGDPRPDTFTPPNPWAVWSGTSFAAPQIAGAVARICAENMGIAPRQALKMLAAGATPEDPGSGYGWTVELLPGT